MYNSAQSLLSFINLAVMISWNMSQKTLNRKIHFLENYLERKSEDTFKEKLSTGRKIIGYMVWNLITAKNTTVAISVLKLTDLISYSLNMLGNMQPVRICREGYLLGWYKGSSR